MVALFCNRPLEFSQTKRMVHHHRRVDEECVVGTAMMREGKIQL
jgi:hypothetical protein